VPGAGSQGWNLDANDTFPCADFAVNVDASANVTGVTPAEIAKFKASLQTVNQTCASQVAASNDLSQKVQMYLDQLPDPSAQQNAAAQAAANITQLFQHLCANPSTPPTASDPTLQNVLKNLVDMVQGAGSNSGGSGSGFASGSGGSMQTGGGSGSGSSSGSPASWVSGFLNQSHLTPVVNVSMLINMLRNGNNPFPGTGPMTKRQADFGMASFNLTSLLGLAGNLINNNGDSFATRCQQLPTTMSMTKRQAGMSAAFGMASLNVTAAFAGILAHCANLSLPSSFTAEVKSAVSQACQAAANIAGNATASVTAGQMLQHSMNVSTFIHNAAATLQTTVNSAQSALTMCQQTLNASGAMLQSQMMQTVTACTSVGASVRQMLGTSFVAGGDNSGASISTSLQTQIATCKSQLAALRTQFQQAASQCPGIVSAVRVSDQRVQALLLADSRTSHSASNVTRCVST
jgi:hypothetical protein